MRYAVPLLGLLLFPAQAPAGEPLGRLFYTPAQRGQLDALRSQKSVAQPAPEQEASPPVPEVVTLGGVVRRSDGKTTVWINNQPIHDGKTAERLPMPSRLRSDDTVSVKLPQADRSIDLKVGQSVEIGSGTIAEPYVRHAGGTPPKPSAAGIDKVPKPDSAPTAGVPRLKSDQDEERGER